MRESNSLCSICGEGSLRPVKGKNVVEYKGHAAELDLQSSLCDTCGCEQSNASQLRANKRAMMAFRKQVDGVLTGIEVRALRERMGLNQAEAAQVFGGGPVAFSKYESDDVAQSEAMDKLLRLAAELPAALELLAGRAGLGRALVREPWREAEGWLVEPRDEAGARRPNLRVISSSGPSVNDKPKYAA